MDKCTIPCEVFGQECWAIRRARTLAHDKGLFLMGHPCNPPKLLCSVPD